MAKSSQRPPGRGVVFLIHRKPVNRLANRFVYADNAATTRLLPPVLEAMTPYLTEEYGNPSSLYSFGQSSRQAVDRRDRGPLSELPPG